MFALLAPSHYWLDATLNRDSVSLCGARPQPLPPGVVLIEHRCRLCAYLLRRIN